MKTIIIDKLLTMSVEELDELVDYNSQLNYNEQIEIDLKGQSIRDIVEKYNLLTLDQVIRNKKDKL